jgi:hypothetical protein
VRRCVKGAYQWRHFDCLRTGAKHYRNFLLHYPFAGNNYLPKILAAL